MIQRTDLAEVTKVWEIMRPCQDYIIIVIYDRYEIFDDLRVREKIAMEGGNGMIL